MMEYWITPNEVIYCDGDSDISTPNHEMVVYSHVTGLVIDALSHSDHPVATSIHDMLVALSEDSIIDSVMFRCTVNDSIDYWYNAGHITDKDADDIWSFVRKLCRPEDRRNRIDILFQILLDHYEGDVRHYAIHTWDWIRVQRNQFQVKNLNRKTVERINDFMLDDNVESYRSYGIEILDPVLLRTRSGAPLRYIGDIPSSDFDSITHILKHRS